jgi:hypothetical protein
MDDSAAAAASEPTVELDEEGRKLQLEAEKAKYRQAIAQAARSEEEARAAGLSGLVPAVEGAPTGTVTLGENAGVFGPWLAHQSIALAASDIAGAALASLGSGEGQARRRVLVVDHRALLAGDVAAGVVRAALSQQGAALAPLVGTIGSALAELGSAVTAYGGDISAAGEGAAEGAGEGAEAEEEVTPSAGPTTVAAAGLGAALDLVGLLRTDYSLTASAVTTSSSELPTLTAAFLATTGSPLGVDVELDDFRTAGASPTLAQLQALLARRTTVHTALADLVSRLAPVEVELTFLRQRRAELEKAWAAWTAADERSDTGGAELRAAVDDLLARENERTRAASPARAVVDHVTGVLEAVDHALSPLLTSTGESEAPVLTAVRRERLSATGEDTRVDYVLYVGVDQVGAESVTRRSLLGTSSQIGFLGAVNVSWLLIDANDTSQVRGGGSQARAGRMRYDLQTGASEMAAVTSGGPMADDALLELERSAKVGVIALAIFLALVSVAGVLRLVFG